MLTSGDYAQFYVCLICARYKMGVQDGGTKWGYKVGVQDGQGQPGRTGTIKSA